MVGLLWCLALLAVLVVGVLHYATIDLRLVKNHGDRIQAHYLALAGIEKAKALLYHEAASRRQVTEFRDSPRDFQDVTLGRGRFRVFHQAPREEGGGILYGVSDEESRLNLNTASPQELTNLFEITPETVAAIVDWRDEDDTPSDGGAEVEYYASAQPPRWPRNRPFQTCRELLMVRGVEFTRFTGEDANQNGLLDPNEDDGNGSYPPDNADGILDAGWSEVLTVNSSARNINSAGEERVNVQTADEATISRVPGLSTEVARAIVAHRERNRLESLVDLLEVAAAPPPNQPQPAPNPVPPGGREGGGPQPAVQTAPPQPAPTGPKVVSEDLLMQVADDLTTIDGQQQAGAININTAGVAVLRCLPGMTPELAQAVVSYRQSNGAFPNWAWLLKVPGMNRQLLKQMSGRITTRSETYRILSEGEVPSSGARKRIQAVVRIGRSTVETLEYREDL